MKELLILILRLRSLLLFIFLEIICLFLVVRYNNSQRQIFISSSNTISGYFYEKTNNLKSFFDLRDENESIAKRNASLLQQIYRGSKRRSYLKGDTVDSLYIFRAARVTNNDILGVRNAITLDAGRNQGITTRMGVITEEGIVGFIANTSAQYSKAHSLLHVDTKVSAKLKSNGVIGTIQWTPGDYRHVQLNTIAKHHSGIAVGDTVTTSGYSLMFPADHMIGTISKIDLASGDNYYDIQVELAADLSKLDLVYIVEHRLKDEILKLEKEDD